MFVLLFVVHNFPSFLIDRKNIASGKSHELRFKPRFTRLRAVASGGAGEALAPPVFGKTVNPISTRGADYTHHITTSPPGISDLATGLRLFQTLEYATG